MWKIMCFFFKQSINTLDCTPQSSQKQSTTPLKCKLFLWWQSYIFSSHYPNLQCHMILQKSFQYADVQKIIYSYSYYYHQLKKQLYCLIFLWKLWCIFNTFFFKILGWIEFSKKQSLLSLHQFNASLLNKIFLLKSLTDPNILNGGKHAH